MFSKNNNNHHHGEAGSVAAKLASEQEVGKQRWRLRTRLGNLEWDILSWSPSQEEVGVEKKHLGVTLKRREANTSPSDQEGPSVNGPISCC